MTETSSLRTDGPIANIHGLYAPAFDETLIFDAIEHHLHARPLRIEQRATKRPRYVYEAALPDGESVIIKIEHAARGDGAIVLEAWAMEQVAARGVPAPRVIALNTSERIVPGRCAIFSRTAGRAMAEPASHYPLAAVVAPDERRLLIEAGHALRPLHEITLEGYGRLDDELYLRTQEVRGVEAHWRDGTLDPALDALLVLAESDMISDAEVGALRDLLLAEEDVFAAPREGRLLHGDFDTTHIFVDSERTHVTGIIDFGDREAGDPLWDLATFSLWEDDARLACLVEGYASGEALAERIDRTIPAYVLARLLRLAAKRRGDGRAEHAAPLIARVRERYLR